MAGFVLVGPKGVATDADLAVWLDMALAYVEGLPPKAPKPLGRSLSKTKSKAIRR
jgi:hypothetical protein